MERGLALEVWQEGHVNLNFLVGVAEIQKLNQLFLIFAQVVKDGLASWEDGVH
jgi:hypothetical protein